MNRPSQYRARESLALYPAGHATMHPPLSRVYGSSARLCDQPPSATTPFSGALGLCVGNSINNRLEPPRCFPQRSRRSSCALAPTEPWRAPLPAVWSHDDHPFPLVKLNIDVIPLFRRYRDLELPGYPHHHSVNVNQRYINFRRGSRYR